MRRRLLALPCVLAVAACGSGGGHPLTRNGVTVEASLHGSELRVTFTPRSGFHLYDTALPVGGADGVGLATRVTVSGSLHATGAVRADQQVRDISVAGVTGPVPVYPQGPVTLRLPVSGHSGTATVQYAACSDQVCLPPVEHLELSVG